MNKSKLFILIAFAFVLCFGISGCTKSAVSEKNLLSYVEQDNPMSSWLYSYYSSSNEIRYYDLKVDKRLTDKSTKSDQVWVSFSADSETDSADVEACMSFTLYNDGWRLDDIEILSTTYTPLTGPSHKLAGSFLSGELQYDYYQFQREEVDLENGFAKLYYKAMNEYNYADYGYELCLNWYYGGAYGPYWDYGEVEVIEETQDWRRIYGVWDGSSGNGEISYSFEIREIDFNLTSGEIIVRGKLNYDASGYAWNSNNKWRPYEIHESFEFSTTTDHILDDWFTIELPFDSSSESAMFRIYKDKSVQLCTPYSSYPYATQSVINESEDTFYNEFFTGNTEVGARDIY